MDLLGGYGSGTEPDSDHEEQPFTNVRPTSVNAAPDGSIAKARDPQRQPCRDDEDADEEAAVPVPRLVAPSAPLVSGDDDAELPAVGPSRPSRPLVAPDEKEIPSISQPEVWSKLPAPKAPARRVVQLLAPLSSALRAAAASSRSTAAAIASDDDDDQPRLKRQKASSSKSKLLDFLPKPVNDLSRASRTLGGGGSDGFGGTGATKLDLGGGGGGKRGRAFDSDDDDDDPMARLGPMPEAGSYAAGPAADGDEVIEVPTAQGGSDGYMGAAPAPAAAAYYVGGEASGGGYGADVQYGSYYEQQQQPGVAAGADKDPGQALLSQALAQEQERAAKRGEKGLDLSSIQFKEVNANDLKYVDPAARAAQQGLQAALGSEYAAALRSQAKPFEGDRMAKRKHQIGTLFYNAKMRELEILEGKAAGMRAKGEAKSKYGW